jgi:SNF2 family DNA or RNA helicase
MEMGLGKTAVILAEFAELVRHSLVDNLIVVCPNSIKGVWLDEMDKVGFPESIGRGAWPSIQSAWWSNNVMVINYEAIITARGSVVVDKFLHRGRCMLVVDESTQIKNPKAQRTRRLIGWAKNVRYIRLLSGQPVVQGPHDLWSQFRVLGEMNGMNYFSYRATHCIMGGYLGKQVMGAKDPEALNALLSKVSFRAKKDQWLDLPKQIFTTRNVELTKDQKKHYDNMKKYLITMIAEQEIDAQMVITQMLKLQQISSGFMLDENGRAHVIPGGNPKLDVIRETMEEVTGKVLVATWFRESTRALNEALEKYNPAVIQGGMSKDGLDFAKDSFEEDPDCRVMICQIQSAKYGLTLLGGGGDNRCATTIFYENGFSLDSRIQFEARNHRIGQDRPVVYVDLVTSDIDRVVIRALVRKQDVAAAIIDNIKVLGVKEGRKAKIS